MSPSKSFITITSLGDVEMVEIGTALGTEEI